MNANVQRRGCGAVQLLLVFVAISTLGRVLLLAVPSVESGSFSASWLMGSGDGAPRFDARSQRNGWKDEWLERWIQEAQARDKKRNTRLPHCVNNITCYIPSYIPVRDPQRGARPQIIPRAIWQTWKTNEVGHIQYDAQMTFIIDNPEFEYFFFTDADVERFMCEAVDDAYVRMAYFSLVPGAAKADVFRLAIVERYGGCYFDSDCKSLRPLKEFVPANASLVTGMGTWLNDFHQWALLYRPHHPLMQYILSAVSRQTVMDSLAGKPKRIVEITGPVIFADSTVKALAEFGCQLEVGRMDVPVRVSGKMTTKEVRTAGVKCDSDEARAKLDASWGRLEIFGKNYLGGNVWFKAEGIDAERKKGGHGYYQDMEDTAETLFADASRACAQRRVPVPGFWR